MWKLRTRFLIGNIKKKKNWNIGYGFIFGKDGRTALITASEAGRLDVVQALISHQASVNAKDQVLCPFQLNLPAANILSHPILPNLTEWALRFS